MKRWGESLLVVALVAFLAVPAMAAVTLTPVVKTRADEWGITVGSGGMAWNRYNRSDSWILADTGGGRFRVNSTRTWAWTGSIEGDVLIYQKATSRRSNIAAFDLTTKSSVQPPQHVNSRWWEYYPKASGEWVLFGRTNVGYGAKREWRKLILTNTVTGKSRTLLRGGPQAHFDPGQVSGDWVVWDECPGGVCDVYRYQISSATKTKIPQEASDQFSPAIAADGTMYFVRTSGNRCGRNASIVRRTLDGTETILYSFPRGVEASYMFLHDGVEQDLYLGDVDCSNDYESDIYMIAGADTAGPVLTPLLEPTDSMVAALATRPSGGFDHPSSTGPVADRRPERI